MADRDTNGAVLYYGDGEASEVFTKVVGLVEVATPFSASRPSIDTTESPSVARTFRGGRPDYGQMSLTIKFDHEEVTHGQTSGLLAKLHQRGPVNWGLKEAASSGTGTAAEYMTFAGVLTGFDVSAADDDIYRATLTIKISGAPVYSATEPALV